MKLRYLALLISCTSFALSGRPGFQAPGNLNVHIVSDEADAVLRILRLPVTNEPDPKDWANLFSSTGYVRLKQRQASMGAGFDDSQFQSFVLSKNLRDRASDLQSALELWKAAGVENAAQRALAYLPRNA